MSCGGAGPRSDFGLLAQPELLAYAGELRDAKNKRDLLDLARKTHAHAENYCWASEEMPIGAPSTKMNVDALYDNVVNVCQQTLARGASKWGAGKDGKQNYCGACVGSASKYSSKRTSPGKRSGASSMARYSHGNAPSNALDSEDLVADYKQQLRSIFGESTSGHEGDQQNGFAAENGFAENGFAENGFAEDGFAEDGFADDGFVYDNDVEPMQLSNKKNTSRGTVRTRTVVVPKSQRDQMAANIIKAVKYNGQPNSSEVRRAKAKQIDWDIDVDRRYVSVVRRNNARFDSSGKHHVPSETHYVYHTPEAADFNALVSSVHKERDRLVKRNYADTGAAGLDAADAVVGEPSAVQTAAQRVEMAQIPAFWLSALMPRLGFQKESQSPTGQVTFRRGQMTIVTEPCPGSPSSVCNATINGIDAKKLATQLLSMIEKAGGLRGILSKLPIGALAGGLGDAGAAGGALGRLGQLGKFLA
jgi:hypothetical protein